MVKNLNKSLMRVLGLSFLVGMSSMSFADIVMNSGTNQASLSWSSEEANQLLNGDVSASVNKADEPSPQGSAKITTSIRSSNGAVQSSPTKTVQIFDTSASFNQPLINARSALVMDGQTGEVLYSKNSNTAFPIASITKLMTAVIIADARLNMSENITLQQIDFAGAGGSCGCIGTNLSGWTCCFCFCDECKGEIFGNEQYTLCRIFRPRPT